MKKFLFIATCLALSFASHSQAVTPSDFVTKSVQSKAVNHDSDMVVLYSKATRDVRKAFISDLKPYTVYTVLLTQTGTAAPVATVLTNQLGTITWARTGVGVYTGTLSGGTFTASKTFFVGAMGGSVTAVRTSGTVVTVSTTSAGSAADAVLSSTSLEIRVYK